MGSNSFGKIFSFTTWGESHGKAIGVVIDGCPSGLALCEEEIQKALLKRAPGSSCFVSPRKERECAQILSGVFEGKTTGTPISILIPNEDQDSSKYDINKHLLRPGHANFTYLEKYGIFDSNGGGRSSGRETACRVAVGCVAKKILKHFQISCIAFLQEMGDFRIDLAKSDYKRVQESLLFCPDKECEEKMKNLLLDVKEEGDSIGAIIGFIAENLPIGMGDPVYEKLEANLAKAMLSIPASKGFDIGSGFGASQIKGSFHNDSFILEKDVIRTKTNHAGGLLGGITTGMPLFGRVAFKPCSSIFKEQETLSLDHKKAAFLLPQGSRHDPCVAIRAVPVVESMLAICLVDALLMQRCSRL